MTEFESFRASMLERNKNIRKVSEDAKEELYKIKKAFNAFFLYSFI